MSSTPPLDTHALRLRLGEQVRRLRLLRNIDQLTLARQAGVSEKALRNLEGGRGSSVATLLQIVQALDGLAWLEALVPAPPVGARLPLQRSEPKRVSRARRRRAAPGDDRRAGRSGTEA